MLPFDEMKQYIKERTGKDLKDVSDEEIATIALSLWKTDYANLKHHQNRTMLRIHLHDFNQHVAWLKTISAKIEKLTPEVLAVEAKEKDDATI